MGYKQVVDRLEEQGRLGPTSWDGSVSAHCPGPVHGNDDRRPSLSVKEGDDGRALVYCHAGCETLEIVEALGLSMSDLFMLGDSPIADIYTYVDEDGKPLIRVLRTSPKGFSQQRYEDGEWKPRLRDARRTLYHLPSVVKAAKAGLAVYVCEGEKDAESLAECGVVATTNLGGAQNWRPEYNEFLRGARVVVAGDNDDAGRQRVERIVQSLSVSKIDCEVVFPHEGCKDVTDHHEAGFTLAELVPQGIDTSVLEPLDWETYEQEEIEWLLEPYVPKRSRVLAFGSAGSLKSLWAIWLAARLTNAGSRVAYFNLEMQPTELAKRMKSAGPTPANLSVFTKLRMQNAQHVMTVCRALKGYDLIVVDSWSSAHTGQNDNDEMARLDNEVFQPIIDHTGATLLILDNTGKSSFTDTGAEVKQQSARGASGKGDKMEVSLWFDRPEESDNYTTRITVKKMRLDYPIPPAIIARTPRSTIEFEVVDKATGSTSAMWPGTLGPPGPENGLESLTEPANSMSPQERRALARLKDTLGLVEEAPGARA